VTLENTQNLTGAKSLRGRRKPCLSGSHSDQLLRGKCLNQSSLAVAARSKHDTLHVVRAAPPDYNINGAVLTRIFARWRAPLDRVRHLCQTFCLTATWLGLAPFCTIAFNDSSIERMLGVDGISESVLYAAGAGTRPLDERHAHLGTMGARVRWRR